MPEEKKDEQYIFLYILLAGVFISILISFYSFYYKKNFDFFVETSCNPETETCFFRNCEEDPDICPPNNLSYYNEYTLSAKDFNVCINEDCTEACATGVINCTKTECTEDDISEGICLLPTGILNSMEEPINNTDKIDINNIDNIDIEI